MLTVATTGFVTMALSIVLLFAFQNLYGYVYQRIGWIVALSMGGLVVGCLWAGRRAARRNSSVHVWRSLIVVDVLLAILALAIPPMLHALATLQHAAAVEWSISMLVAVTGLFGGATFALAGHLQLTLSGQAGGAAGSVVGADHAGACLGALLCGVLLVPVFGTVMTAWLLAALKLSSAATLAALRRPALRA
jgi:spermidine synthase